MIVTIRDVAKRAGVSIATVSRVLNKSKPVSDELKKRIMDAVEETGYLPNAVARSMIQKRTGLFGVIIPEIFNPYFSGLVEGIESVSKEFQYHLMLSVSEKDPEREKELLQIYRSRQMEGIILAAARLEEDQKEILARLGIPCVVIGQRVKGLKAPSVVINNWKAAFEATDYLIQLGHRRIGMIGGPFWDVASGQERYQGFRDALASRALPCREEWVSEGEGFLVEDGYKGMEILHSAPELPTAVFCACDRIAVGAIRYLEGQGLQVPEDVSVIGFDDEELASIIHPRLTTIRHSPFEMGRRAATLLTEMLHGNQSLQTAETLEHSLIVRESTIPLSS
ncbi:LacI family DNA-binding transcriptional regulator [Salinithrix halophila]|uniref:LacI family DNA-binding transcriptional regulator n=1 Tax=Salinithrix halophila TaxID=1485204 RepID=A0ABV8JID5_9BACL